MPLACSRLTVHSPLFITDYILQPVAPFMPSACWGPVSTSLHLLPSLSALPTSQLEKIRVVAVFLVQMPAQCSEPGLSQAQSTGHRVTVRW